MNPATDPQARAKLLEALRAPGATVTGAATAAGYARTHVYKIARSDAEVRAALGAIVGGRGRRAKDLPAAAGAQDQLGRELGAGAVEAVARLRTILGREPDGETMYASDQVRAAKVLLDLVRAPAKAHVVTARTLGPGGASEISATSTMTPEQREALAEKMFGS